MDGSNELYVETYYGPKDAPYALYRKPAMNHYFWKYKGNTRIPVLEGMFTDKAKALKALTTYFKRETKPYHKKTAERFGGQPWEDTWKLPPPVVSERQLKTNAQGV